MSMVKRADPAPASVHRSEEAFIIKVFSALGILATGIFGLLHILVEHNPTLGYLELLGSGGMVLNVLALVITKNSPLARNFFLLLVLALLMMMLLTGGIEGTGIFWFFIFPPAAFFLSGKVRGMIWMGALYLLMLAVVYISFLMNSPLPYPLVTIRQLLITLFVTIISIYIYQNSREKAELARRESQQDLQEYLDNMMTLNAKISPDRKILFANKVAKEASGLGDAVIGADFVDGNWWRFDPAVHKRVATAFQTALQGKKVSFVERLKVETPKGPRILPINFGMQPITDKGRIKYILAEGRDISEELEVEHAKSEFVTLASHQLRTPMSAIQWYAEMLLSGDAGKLTDEQHQHIQQIYTSNQRLNAIVDSMLMVSTLELGRLVIQPEPTDLVALAKKILSDELHLQPKYRELSIGEDYSAQLPKLPLDPVAIKTILRNVLSNAIKYTPDKGRITIKIHPSTKKLSGDSHGSVQIIVTDTGYGIPAAEQKNMFVKLFRAGNIKEKDTDGTGLGLYIIKELIEQVGGQISFVSAEDKGSTFTITLPIEGMKQRGRQTKANKSA